MNTCCSIVELVRHRRLKTLFFLDHPIITEEIANPTHCIPKVTNRVNATKVHGRVHRLTASESRKTLEMVLAYASRKAHLTTGGAVGGRTA